MFKVYIEIGELEEGEWGIVIHKDTLFDGENTRPEAVYRLADQFRRLSIAFNKIEEEQKMARTEFRALEDGDKSSG